MRGPGGDHTSCAGGIAACSDEREERSHSGHDVRAHLTQRPGGQGVVGSNPASPTVRRQGPFPAWPAGFSNAQVSELLGQARTSKKSDWPLSTLKTYSSVEAFVSSWPAPAAGLPFDTTSGTDIERLGDRRGGDCELIRAYLFSRRANDQSVCSRLQVPHLLVGAPTRGRRLPGGIEKFPSEVSAVLRARLNVHVDRIPVSDVEVELVSGHLRLEVSRPGSRNTV